MKQNDMKKNSLVLVFLVFIFQKYFGQDITFKDSIVYRILNECNYKNTHFTIGKFDIYFSMKFMNRQDTSKITGRCFFDKTKVDKDSIGRFCIYKGDSLLFLYDHEIFYEISYTDSIMFYGNTKDISLPALTKGATRYELINYPLLKNYKSIEISNYHQAEYVGLDNIDNRPCYKIVNYEYDKSGKVENIKKSIWIDTVDYYLIRITDELTFQGMQQYKEYTFSEYEKISESIISNCKIDDLINGYKTKLHPQMKNEKNNKIEDKLNKKEHYNNLPVLFTLEKDSFAFDRINGKILLLDFWYTSCLPCILFVPTLKKINEEYKNRGLVVCNVNSIDKDTNSIHKFKNKYGLEGQVVLDSDKILKNIFYINIYPTVVLIDVKQNKEVYRVEGYDENNYIELKAKIEEIIDR